MSAEALFQPFRLKSLELKSRIVMAPMTRSFSPAGVPGPDVAAYYARRAAAEVGLIVSEGTVIERPASANDPKVPRFWGQESLAGWKAVIDEVHAAGGVMAPQLWHVGAVPGQGDWTPPGPPESPSGLAGPDRPNGVAMTEADIADAIAAYGRAAGDTRRLGFDAVELHGAHGYLIDQFFWGATNRRDDRWGGASLAERCRFAVEVLKAVREATGPDFPVIIRLSQWKIRDFGLKLAATPAEMEAWLGVLVDAGADAFHCSQRRFWEAEFPSLQGKDSDLNFAGWAKRLTGKPTITVGSVGLTGDFIAGFGGEVSHPASLEELLRRLDRGDFDLVAVGRALLADPQWAAKVHQGRTAELRDFSREALAVLS
jgi:2,4-dienoyl-CoA reductase-like NADH-dependent reductase (Old Yellow Enzyme family)